MAEPRVVYNFLGKCGVKVSNICLGTMTFGRNPKDKLNTGSDINPSRIKYYPSLLTEIRSTPRHLSEEASHKIMDVYAKYGGNFIDTANVYSGGISEGIVGNWLAKHDRKQFVLATKVRLNNNKQDTNVNNIGLSRRHIIESCEASLERLKTNYIDLFQSHCWDSATPIDETLRTFDDLIRWGKIRYFGISNVCGWQMQKIVCRLEAMGLNSCVSLQQQYSLMARQSEFEEFMVCHNEGIGVLPWSPLKGGLLTGKYKRDEELDPTGSRLGCGKSQNIVLQHTPNWDKFVNDEDYWKLMDTLTEIAKTHGKTISQVAIRWLLQKDIVASVIVGVTSVEQLEDNMGAAKGWTLSDEEMTILNETSARLNPYPYEMLWRVNNERYNHFNRAYKP